MTRTNCCRVMQISGRLKVCYTETRPDVAMDCVQPAVTAPEGPHGGLLMGFYEHVLGMTPGNGWRFRRQNAAFNCFEYLDGKVESRDVERNESSG
jgi:hypothetical protein